MEHVTDFQSLEPHSQTGARKALAALDNGINTNTGTVIAAVAQTDQEFYVGVTLWLSGTSMAHAEFAAITEAVSAGDREVHSLYLAMRRKDGADPGYVTPCGSCRQLIVDLATFTARPITLYSLNDALDGIQIIEHTELLPFAFGSQTLRRAGEAHRAASAHARAGMQ